MRHNFDRVVSLSVSGLSGIVVKTQTKQYIFPGQQKEEVEEEKEKILTALSDSATSTSRN